MKRIGFSCLFNCLPNFNRNNLSLSATRRQYVETLMPQRKRLFNTSEGQDLLLKSCSTTTTQTHTSEKMVSHTEYDFLCINISERSKEKNENSRSQNFTKGYRQAFLPLQTDCTLLTCMKSFLNLVNILKICSNIYVDKIINL